MRTRSPTCVVVTLWTGVPKSVTSRRRRRRVGQARAQELDDQVVALLANVDADLVVGQLDDDATGAVGAAPEVDVAQRQLVAIEAFGERVVCPLELASVGRHRVLERDHQHLAVDLRPDSPPAA